MLAYSKYLLFVLLCFFPPVATCPDSTSADAPDHCNTQCDDNDCGTGNTCCYPNNGCDHDCYDADGNPV